MKKPNLSLPVKRKEKRKEEKEKRPKKTLVNSGSPPDNIATAAKTSRL